jgi:hypothetical protein
MCENGLLPELSSRFNIVCLHVCPETLVIWDDVANPQIGNRLDLGRSNMHCLCEKRCKQKKP